MLTRLLNPWDFSGKNTRVGCRFLLQGSSYLLHWQAESLPLGHLGSPNILASSGDVRFSFGFVWFVILGK